jgi:predicted GNAT family N-acyltransferase
VAVAFEQSGAEVNAAIRHHADFDNAQRIARIVIGEVELFDITDRARLEAALGVRFAVFVDEQHVPADEEIDEHDRTDRDARHALLRDGERAVAAGRYYVAPDGAAQIGRMAVIPGYRRSGAGRRILDALIADARSRGFARAALNAQVHAAAFYAKAGFTPFGPQLVECDILHQPMERAL